MDDNGDGFMDLPKTRLGAVANRWLYTADNGAQVRWGFKYLAENRLSGQKHYKASMREEMDTDWDKGAMYGSQIKNRELNAYFKFGMPVGPGVYDEDQQDELRSNIAFVADYDASANGPTSAQRLRRYGQHGFAEHDVQPLFLLPSFADRRRAVASAIP